MQPRRRPTAWMSAVWLLAVCVAATLGCPAGDPHVGYQLPDPVETGVLPGVGSYHFDAKGCFSVTEDAAGQRYVRFASDCWAYSQIPVLQGAFIHTKGDVYEPGTVYKGYNCPTDGYGISGSFVSPERAEGMIKYSYDCELTGTAAFTATLAE